MCVCVCVYVCVCREQGELQRRIRAGVPGSERGAVLRDQERLMERMERKEAHITQLHTHTQQVHTHTHTQQVHTHTHTHSRYTQQVHTHTHTHTSCSSFRKLLVIQEVVSHSGSR